MAEARVFTVEVAEVSKEVSHKEKVMLKDTTDCERFDRLTADDQTALVDVAFWAVLSIHNEKSKDKNYKNYVIVDKEGKKYVTGSQSFWNAFMDIWSEMKDEKESWSLKVYRVPSKNFKGKDFLTCSIA